MRVFLFSALTYFCLCLNVSAKQWESPENYIGEDGNMIAQSNDQYYFIKMLEKEDTEEQENNYKDIIDYIRADKTVTTADIETLVKEKYDDDSMIYMMLASFFADITPDIDDAADNEGYRDYVEFQKQYLIPQPDEVDIGRTEYFAALVLSNAPNDLYKAHMHSLLYLAYGNPEHALYNPEKWFEHITKAAEYGLGSAKFHLGAAYLHGENVEQDIPKAYEWIKKAADENDYFYAIILLGGMLYERSGDDDPYPGFPYDNAQLIHYAQKSIDLYNSYGGYGMMALAYEYGGKNLQPDFDKAFENAKKCTEYDDFIPCYKRLGEYYRDGVGTDVDLDKAREMFNKAVKKGDKEAEELLQSLSE